MKRKRKRGRGKRGRQNMMKRAIENNDDKKREEATSE